MDVIWQKNVSLQSYSTFGLMARSALLCHWQYAEQLPELIAESFRQPETLWIGAGSNTIFLRDFKGLVIKIATRGIEVIAENEQDLIVRVAAGEVWHDFVCYALAQGWHGIENLALIPGTVGAAPVQNIGAYGSEVQEVIEKVHITDTTNGQNWTLSHQECAFSYRQSIFKRHKNWLIRAVDFKLSKNFHANLRYGDLAKYFSGSLKEVNAQAVFDAVCAIRQQKLPDWRIHGNVGSFFHNPVLSPVQAALFLQQFPHAPHHVQIDGNVKIPAAWLIDYAGLKGFAQNGVQVHPQHALVLINQGKADADALKKMSDYIQEKIKEQFNIYLKIEPYMVE